MTTPAARPHPALPANPPVRSVVPPLLPVLLPLVVAAILLGALFAWLFPPAAGTGAPVVRFTDVTAAAGLRFSHRPGADEAPTTLGGAVTVLDYNADGRPDLFFVNGAPWPWEETLEKRLVRSSALYRNDGNGRFTDVTAAAGLNTEMQGMAAAAGDYDADGHPDLFVSAVGTNRLFRNLGGGRFEDVTEFAGLGGDENTWSTGAAWLDTDADGRLDLVVLHYARWPQEVGLGSAFAVAEMGRSYGNPTGFFSSPPTVWHNRGDGRFAAAADSAGLRDIDPETGRPVAWPLALTVLDVNGDRRSDLLIAYHNHGPALFLAQGDGTFARQAGVQGPRQEGAAAGLASASALPFAQSPGDRDRLQALLAAGLAEDTAAGLALASKLGVVVLDLDLDGRPELFSGQGRAEPGTNKFEGGRAFAAVPRVLWSRGETWQPLADEETALPALTARGVAAADFDGDGDPDLVIAQHNGPAVLLRNDQRTGSPWLRLQLTATRSEPGAGGARVEVHTPRRVLTQTAGPALGFMTQSESTLTFGLGDDARVRKLVIQWPSGQVQELRPTGLNQTLAIREP
ncbi:FG-GAP repeat protein [Lacunisphaera limnophila]|uniref:FG-GAP repeat protein n=1 Tax=Lacunisphaera limnophila TaxID=1838286 RepID=A0A1D8AV40_9BACT|nr:CRTAC1 family protein [Lacunisphaera limnophila]AOS44741.1 FG-GAP repeat protein [Lacunisphaera limnophila]